MVDVGEALEALGQAEPDARVRLSRQLVKLLSDQLYQSPIKAIEELVVNSYDADADHCWVRLGDDRILVFDDGIGMDLAGLSDLWHVGHSSKRDSQVQKLRKRKQIGKFGIGKLATAAIADRVTYITKAVGTGEDRVLTTSVNYAELASTPEGPLDYSLTVRRITVDDLLAQQGLRDDLALLEVKEEILRGSGGWTLALLESMRDGTSKLNKGTLKWVLSTAMPLGTDFKLRLDDADIESAKQGLPVVTEFLIHNIGPKRLKAVSEATKEEWTVDPDRGLLSATFPSGVRGKAMVTRQTIYGGKSDDLQRSHGFFVRVRGRLVSLEDPLFGIKPSSHAILNRFYCELDADDLDDALTAPREGVEATPTRKKFLDLLNEIFNEARSRYEAWERETYAEDPKAKEHERNYVNPRLVERPIADALLGAAERAAREEAEARVEGLDDDSYLFKVPDPLDPAEEAAAASLRVAHANWYYIDLPEDFDLAELTKNLYSDDREESYRYERTGLGKTSPMVRLDPTSATFTINVDHDLVRSHDENPAAQKLLEDMVTAEALLEVYLREDGMDPSAIESVLSRRDELLRSLTKDRQYSLKAIASDLRDSASDEDELEVQLVIAARALGFLARHIGGSGEPDGIARMWRPEGEVKITLEAKSSGKQTAGLAAIGFDGLEQHLQDTAATGCLLVAPGYPGGSKGENASAAKRAVNAKVSCWTVDQLARVVENAHARHFTAGRVLSIIETKFTPEQVSAAIDALFDENPYSDQELYGAVLRALRSTQGRMRGTPRTPTIILTEVTREKQFEDLEMPAVERALRDLAGASGGAMNFEPSQRIVVHTTIDELERRVAGLLGDRGKARHAGRFTRDEAETADWER